MHSTNNKTIKNNKTKKLFIMAEMMENGHNMVPEGKINAALTTGIIGTALGGLLALGAMSNNCCGNNKNGGGLLGGLFGNNNCGCDQVTMSHEDLYLERKLNADYLSTTVQYYEGKIDGQKALTDAFFAAYQRDVQNSFDLYKYSRDSHDSLSKRIDEVDKKVDVMSAIRPYQDALINAKIDNTALIADFNLARRTCRMITGELVLPSTPTVTGYPSYNPCNFNTATNATGNG